MEKRAQEILDFWFKETTPKKRFKKHKGIDQESREKFLKDYQLEREKDNDDWKDN